ncbi:UNVERIFIED_CONTAM: hypothetical protein Sangu_3111300 [Sesamum angustifolium]|uniref:Uncharacterized protein n=1 Tax=Sesamum angustifolium TaxID=2727405 RepID=A0AAW2K7N1_9LAMI
MEDSAAKDHQSSAAGRSTSRLLRYPLRSATRSREEKPSVADSNTDSATKRGRPASTVSKSVGILDLSGKEKSAKPPRRLSVPSKSNATPAPKSFGNITPFLRLEQSALLIKLSESAAKHLISLGFFKLALEAGCEPIQRMSDELKSYVRRHNLSEFGESLKELFESYKITENFEQSQASETCSQVPAEGNQLSDDDVNSSSSSITNAEKLTPKLLDVNAAEIHQIKKENDEITQKNDSMKKTRRSAPKNAASSKSGSEVRGRSIQKKPQKPMKQESGQANNRVKKQGHKSAARAEGSPNSAPEEALEENKENMATPQRE